MTVQGCSSGCTPRVVVGDPITLVVGGKCILTNRFWLATHVVTQKVNVHVVAHYSQCTCSCSLQYMYCILLYIVPLKSTVMMILIAEFQLPFSSHLPTEPLTITQDIQNQTVTRGENANFTCPVRGTNISISWEIVGRDVYRGCDNQAFCVDDSSTFTIDSTELAEDEFTVRCVVDQTFGDHTNMSSSTGKLTVRSPPPPPSPSTSKTHTQMLMCYKYNVHVSYVLILQ